MAHIIKKESSVRVLRWEELAALDKELLLKAAEARRNAVAQYSHYQVGAAFLWADGVVSIGCNVENCPYEALHAERCAIGNRIVEHGLGLINRCAVIGAPEGADRRLPPPVLSDEEFRERVKGLSFRDASVCCGQCLQDIMEFAGGAEEGITLMEVVDDVVLQITLNDALPTHFGPIHLGVDYNKILAQRKAKK